MNKDTCLTITEMTFGSAAVPIVLGYDCLYDIAERISNMTRHCILVCDRKLYPGRAETLHRILSSKNRADLFFIYAIEQNKRLATVEALLDYAETSKADRTTVFVSVGGGIVGNITGFAASVLYRGLRLVHVPTTLLAMSDSVLSLKQAVNGINRKNVYGSYLTPSLIAIDMAFLHSLPFKQLSCGFVELCKNGLAVDSSSIPSLSKLAPHIEHHGSWNELVRLGLAAKSRVLSSDPHEKGVGLVFEYGHTVGHAIELAYDVPHGHAIGLGMLVAARISRHRGWLSKAEETLHRKMLLACNAPTTMPNADPAVLLQFIVRDNKRGYVSLNQDECSFVLLRKIGIVNKSAGLPLTIVKKHELTKAFTVLHETNNCRPLVAGCSTAATY